VAGIEKSRGRSMILIPHNVALNWVYSHERTGKEKEIFQTSKANFM
jgi:hypothetical protein